MAQDEQVREVSDVCGTFCRLKVTGEECLEPCEDFRPRSTEQESSFKWDVKPIKVQKTKQFR